MFKCTFDEGQFVFYEGDLGDSVYIIKEGELECIKNNNVIRVLKQGEYFGEYALLFNSDRTLSCKAKNKLCVYKISNNLLEETLGNEYKDLILKSIIKEAFKHNENLNLFSENFYIDEIYPNTIIKLYEDNEKIIDKKDFNDSKIQERYLCVIICGNVIIKNDTTVFSENFSALLLYNDDFIKASVALSFELALTIFDISEIGLNSIYEQLNLDVYDFWKVILPSNINLYHVELQKHLEEIDYQLSTFLIWRNPSDKFKNELKEFLENENIIENENEKDSIFKLIRHESFQQSAFLCHDKRDFEIPFINEKFKTNSTNKLIFKDCYEYVENYNKIIGIGVLLQRLIVYCITLNKFIFDNFSNETIESKDSLTKPIEIDEYIRKESELIIKVILTNYNDISILWGLHIDQFVLSCILLVLDKHNLFNFPGQKNINWNNESNNVKINKNILHNSYNKSKFSIEQVNEDSHIFYHVKFSNQKFVNIFEFYHDKFKIKFIFLS